MPAAYISRTYRGERDLAAILGLLAAARPAGMQTEYPGERDLRELLALPDVQANTRLWFDPASLECAGFALLDRYANLWFEWAPAAGADLAAAMIAWGETCLRRAAAAGAEGPARLDTNCRLDRREQIALLERHGFQADSSQTLRMARSLDAPLPAPELPAGFSLRPVAGEAEAPAVVELHRAAFGTLHMTLEERLASMRVPGYLPEGDLVVVAPDGSLAGYCMAAIEEAPGELPGGPAGGALGLTDPVAVHPAYQGRGLARALLLAGCRLLQTQGIREARLSTTSDNLAMQRAAAAVGFAVCAVVAWFSRPVDLNQE